MSDEIIETAGVKAFSPEPGFNRSTENSFDDSGMSDRSVEIHVWFYPWS
jgi:hypothetical protein